MPAGRPPVPNELKRLRGTARPDRVPPIADVSPLPGVDVVPAMPPDLGVNGARLWDDVWGPAITWISPASDRAAVEHACRLADAAAYASQRYRETGDPTELRALTGISKSLADALAFLGFTPAARTRLGVAEVTRVSKLDALRRKQG